MVKHDKLKDLKNTYLEIAEYLCLDTDKSIKEEKWLLRFRVEDIPVKVNRIWPFENILCTSHDLNSEEKFTNTRLY